MSLWTGIINTERATDWESVGSDSIGISRANCVTGSCNILCCGNGTAGAGVCSSCSGGTVTGASIAAALSSAPVDTVVRVSSGNFTGLTGFTFDVSRVTLRGAGAMSTRLVFTTGAGGSACGWIQNSVAIKMCAGNTNIGCTTGCGGSGPENSATWSAGYAKGTTVITVSSTTNMVARSGTVPGTTIFLDQLDDGSDGFPATGDIFQCDHSGAPGNVCSWEGNTGNPHRTSRSQVELHEVIAINGSNVTIDPPIHAPNFRSGQTPQAWWGSAGNHVKASGVENMTIDFSALGQHADAIYAVNTSNCWSKGNRYIFNANDQPFLFHLYLLNAFRFTQRDSYTYGPHKNSQDPITNYVWTALVTGSCLFENNIVHHYCTGPAASDCQFGDVIAYNYTDDAQYTTSFQPHGSGDMFVLYEGNNIGSFWSDNIHGTHHFITLFRNHVDYTAHNGLSAAEHGGLLIYSHNRFFNVIGNVLGHANFSSYSNTTGAADAVYILNYNGSNSGPFCQPNCPITDTHVTRTLLRWGNYDSVNNAVRFIAGENPDAITNYPSLASPSQTFPASFYRAAKPTVWWGTPYGEPPWPPIGPDVTSGALASSGTHANKIPARLCFENVGSDSTNYSGSNPSVKAFDAGTCYIGSAAVPTRLAMILR